MLRPALLVLLLSVAPAALAQPAAPAQPATAQAAPFALDPLPYAVDALEPVIDRETMQLHHGRHHQAYVDALNRAVAADPALRNLGLEAMLARVSTLPKAIRDNGGGHWNHRFFWSIMAPPGAGGQPSPALLAAIERDFGSLEKMQAAFRQAGLGQFGSGWAWLIVRPDGRLAVTATPNQDNPLMDVVPDSGRGQPILGNDVWEHAYYLGYRNRRGDYLDRWWEVVNWKLVNALYEQATRPAAARRGRAGSR
ncbi:MAG: superoxide dismutase [Sphingomonadaceae bacterium]